MRPGDEQKAKETVNFPDEANLEADAIPAYEVVTPKDSTLREWLEDSVPVVDDGPGEEDGPWAEGWEERIQGPKYLPAARVAEIAEARRLRRRADSLSGSDGRYHSDGGAY